MDPALPQQHPLLLKCSEMETYLAVPAKPLIPEKPVSQQPVPAEETPKQPPKPKSSRSVRKRPSVLQVNLPSVVLEELSTQLSPGVVRGNRRGFPRGSARGASGSTQPQRATTHNQIPIPRDSNAQAPSGTPIAVRVRRGSARAPTQAPSSGARSPIIPTKTALPSSKPPMPHFKARSELVAPDSPPIPAKPRSETIGSHVPREPSE